jgi:hypothetical protein
MFVSDHWLSGITTDVKLAEDLLDWKQVQRGDHISQAYDSH